MHGVCFGEEAYVRNLAFFRVKRLQPTMKGSSRLVAAAAHVFQIVKFSKLFNNDGGSAG